VKAQTRRDTVPEQKDLHLAELLDFRPDQGVIRLHEQRVVILSAAAMGLLRKELIDTLGVETAERLELRFGFADGYHDAVNLRERSTWTDPLEGIRAGAMLQTLEGIVRVDVRKTDYDAATGRFEEHVAWHDSYVAEQHLHHYGTADSPVCWSLVGYASGFVSACLGKEVYFRETSCAAQGAKHCVAVGRDAESWGADLEAIRADFQAATVGHEVERGGQQTPQGTGSPRTSPGASRA
jgi:two-component system response regulator HydG